MLQGSECRVDKRNSTQLTIQLIFPSFPIPRGHLDISTCPAGLTGYLAAKGTAPADSPHPLYHLGKSETECSANMVTRGSDGARSGPRTPLVISVRADYRSVLEASVEFF